jgi:hypothetical protein
MARGSLREGAYPEIELCAAQIKWKGKVDLLVVAQDACEITDFKTGAPVDGHGLQIQIYALLWSRDATLNPAGRPADRLVLGYSSGDVEVVAPTEEQLAELESDIVGRSAAARLAIAQHPPEARPAPERCGYCGVRQLCTEYWTAGQSDTVRQARSRRFFDIEVTVSGRHGLSSWDVQVAPSQLGPAAGHGVLRTGGDIEFCPGDRLRVLDAAVAVDDESEGQPAVITLGTLSEVYACA